MRQAGLGGQYQFRKASKKEVSSLNAPSKLQRPGPLDRPQAYSRVTGVRWCCEIPKPGSPGNRSPGPKQWPRQAARTRTDQCGQAPRTRVWRPRAGRAQHPATPRHKRRISRSTSPNRPRSYDNLCRKTRRQNNGRNFQCSTGNGSFVLSKPPGKMVLISRPQRSRSTRQTIRHIDVSFARANAGYQNWAHAGFRHE